MPEAQKAAEYMALIEECRAHCLWFLAPDAIPTGRDEQILILDYVERYGRRDEFLRARRLKQWLSQHSNEAFAVSSPPRDSTAKAMVSDESETTLVQWLQDSAFRFFPLVTNEELGLTLHPFDLATNKVLAMAGRLEARDWIDVIHCHEHLQPLGYLVWAACGKDPGFSPISLLQDMRRSSKYSQAELDMLDFEGTPPSAAELGGAWHRMVREAPEVCDLLPIEQIGTCVVTESGELVRDRPADLAERLRTGKVRYHRGTIGGAWPTFPTPR